MGFFDTLGNVFGFGNSRNAYNYSPSAPQFISPEYIDNLNDLARVASSRTADTSLADALLKQQTDRALKDQYSLAASTKGQVNPALLQRQIMKNAAETGQKNAQSAAIVQAQAQREQQKQNDALALEYRKMALNAKLAQADANLKAQGYQTQLAQAATQGTTGAIGGLFSAGGHVPVQKGDAIRFQFYDTATGAPGRGYDLNNLMLQVGVKAGIMKLNALIS